jgi:hypothetical protein
MIYSVWDHARREYDYYQTPNKNGATQAPKPGHLRNKGELGLTPEEAAWPLPANAVRVGGGKYAKGMIATSKGGLSGLGFIPDLSPMNLVLMGALGWVAWKYVLPKRRRR